MPPRWLPPACRLGTGFFGSSTCVQAELTALPPPVGRNGLSPENQASQAVVVVGAVVDSRPLRWQFLRRFSWLLRDSCGQLAAADRSDEDADGRVLQAVPVPGHVQCASAEPRLISSLWQSVEAIAHKGDHLFFFLPPDQELIWGRFMKNNSLLSSVKIEPVADIAAADGAQALRLVAPPPAAGGAAAFAGAGARAAAAAAAAAARERADGGTAAATAAATAGDAVLAPVTLTLTNRQARGFLSVKSTVQHVARSCPPPVRLHRTSFRPSYLQASVVRFSLGFTASLISPANETNSTSAPPPPASQSPPLPGGASADAAARLATAIDATLRLLGAAPPPAAPASGLRVFFFASDPDASSTMGANASAPPLVPLGPDAAAVALVDATPPSPPSSSSLGVIETFLAVAQANAMDLGLGGLLPSPAASAAAGAAGTGSRGAPPPPAAAGGGGGGGRRLLGAPSQAAGAPPLATAEEGTQQGRSRRRIFAAAAPASSARVVAVVDASGAAPGVHSLALWARNEDDGGTTAYTYLTVTVDRASPQASADWQQKVTAMARGTGGWCSELSSSESGAAVSLLPELSVVAHPCRVDLRGRAERTVRCGRRRRPCRRRSASRPQRSQGTCRARRSCCRRAAALPSDAELEDPTHRCFAPPGWGLLSCNKSRMTPIHGAQGVLDGTGVQVEEVFRRSSSPPGGRLAASPPPQLVSAFWGPAGSSGGPGGAQSRNTTAAGPVVAAVQAAFSGTAQAVQRLVQFLVLMVFGAS